jgi:hypothetical protein
MKKTSEVTGGMDTKQIVQGRGSKIEIFVVDL